MKQTFVEKAVIQEVLDNGGNMKLDFNDDSHYQFFMDKVGGEEMFERCFPVMHRNLQSRRADRVIQAEDQQETARISTSGAAKLKGKKDKERPGEGVRDTIGIAPPFTKSVSDSKMNAHSLLYGEFIDEKPMVLAQTYIINNDNGELSNIETRVFSNTDQIVRPMRTTMTTREKVNLTSVGIVTYPEVVRGEARTTTEMTVSTPAESFIDNELIESFHVIDPNKKTDQYPDTIRVSYLRDALVPDADYKIKNAPAGNNFISLKLPVRVEITVKDGFRITGLSRRRGWKVHFKVTESGMLHHMATYQDIENYRSSYKEPGKGDRTISGIDISQDARKIIITMPEDWNNRLDFGPLKDKTRANMHIYGDFHITLESDKMQEFNQAVSFFSYEGTESISSVRIKPLYFQWGCIAMDERITMVDRSACRIDLLKIGDMVLGGDGQGCRITNIVTGPQAEIVSILTSQGKHVRLTDDHTVFTVEQGAVPVRLLLKGMTLETIDGEEEVMAVERQPYDNKVYNLKFETSAPFYAGNIKVGDFEMQQSIRGNEKKEVPVENEEVRQMAMELAALCTQLNQEET